MIHLHTDFPQMMLLKKIFRELS